MFLFSFGHKKYTDKPPSHKQYVNAKRWAVSIESFKYGIELNLNRQLYYIEDENWFPQGRYISLSLSNSWYLGSSHEWDGDYNCSFSLGFFSIHWRWFHCEKCLS